MSRTLNLVDILLTTGRNLFLMGRFTEALIPLTKLAGFRQLPEHLAEEVQFRFSLAKSIFSKKATSWRGGI